MNIGCDIDGVLCNIEPGLTSRLSKVFDVPANEIKRDKFWMHERFGIDMAVMDREIEKIFNKPDFWEDAEPYKDNIIALRKAAHAGHEITLITGRKNLVRHPTANWLKAWIVPWNTLLMDALQVKHRAMKFAGCDLLIEDRFAEAFTVAGQGFRSYLIKREYNESHMTTHSDVVWVNTIEEALMLEGILD